MAEDDGAEDVEAKLLGMMGCRCCCTAGADIIVRWSLYCRGVS